MASPDPLQLAATGDEDAIEHVISGVSGPVFDVALHLCGEKAGEVAAAALASLVATFRSEKELGADPLAVGVAAVVRAATGEGAGSEGPWTQLEADQRQAVLVAGASNLEGEELGLALGLPAAEASARFAAGLKALSLDEDGLGEALDEVAAQTAMPMDLIDRALDD